MTKYLIEGGHPLHGTIEISGAKNAAVAIIPAALLVDGVCRIENVPQISDVTLILQILRELGADVRTINRTTVEIDCSHIRNRQVPYELARKIRASYYLVGALLGRFGWAEVPLPGGCNLGGRPIDQHIKGFVAMGADVDVRGGYIHAKAKNGRMCGTQIYLDIVSVGATMNIMLAAVKARGTTIIENAAKEPHVVDLAKGHVAAVKYVVSGLGCEVFNLGTGIGYSVLDMVHAFEKANGVKVPYQIVGRRPGDLPTCYADPAKSERVLGWKAEKNLEDMCRDSWNWQSKNPMGYGE